MNAIYVLLFLGAVTLFLFAGMFLAGALIGLARLCKEAMTALRATRAAPAATTPVVAAAGASASRHASAEPADVPVAMGVAWQAA